MIILLMRELCGLPRAGGCSSWDVLSERIDLVPGCSEAQVKQKDFMFPETR